jgi:hypothetical protein
VTKNKRRKRKMERKKGKIKFKTHVGSNHELFCQGGKISFKEGGGGKTAEKM